MKLSDGARSRQWVFTVWLCNPLHLFYTGTAPGTYFQITSMGVWGQDLGHLALTGGVSSGLSEGRSTLLIVESLQHGVAVDTNEGE